MEGREYHEVLNSPTMHLMYSRYHVPLSLEYVKMDRKERCDVFPCKNRTKYRLVEYASTYFSFNNGGGGGGCQMYMCYPCFQKHRELVIQAKKRGEKEVVYIFDNWLEK
jgi:hypothetical protein